MLINMDGNWILSKKYLDLGFNIAGFAGTALVLIYRNRIIFIISSGLLLRNDHISRLCDSYLDLKSNTSPSKHIRKPLAGVGKLTS